jgi:hypothetical protein
VRVRRTLHLRGGGENAGGAAVRKLDRARLEDLVNDAARDLLLAAYFEFFDSAHGCPCGRWTEWASRAFDLLETLHGDATFYWAAREMRPWAGDKVQP